MAEISAFAGKPSLIFKFTGITAPAIPRLHAAIARMNEMYKMAFFTANGEPASSVYLPKAEAKKENSPVEIVRILTCRLRNQSEDTGDPSAPIYYDSKNMGTYTIEVQVLYFLTQSCSPYLQFVDEHRKLLLTPFGVVGGIFDAIGVFPQSGSPYAFREKRGDEPPYVK
ncbi:MAG: hypothetical protein HYT29_00485 [Parcubacteria group bacterium]|nr:hypothetical protein [Parcubacteria group bacterium]